jgi:hypothetical protein
LYIAGAVGEGDLKPSNFADGVKSPQSMGVSMFAKPPKTPLTWKLFCLSVQDGQTLWEREIVQKKASYPIHPSNSWQTETPATDDAGVYVFCGAAGVLTAFGHDGVQKWQQQTEICRTNNGFGTGSSPALVDGRVIVQLYGEESAVVRCFAAAGHCGRLSDRTREHRGARRWSGVTPCEPRLYVRAVIVLIRWILRQVPCCGRYVE